MAKFDTFFIILLHISASFFLFKKNNDLSRVDHFVKMSCSVLFQVILGLEKNLFRLHCSPPEWKDKNFLYFVFLRDTNTRIKAEIKFQNRQSLHD